jgi:EAL domain-containing protein (putative c-di-GMP-specific phosphodiesterase class I)
VRAQVAKVVADAPAARGLVFINLHLLDLFDKQLTSPFAPLSKVASRVVLEITERTSLEGQLDLRYRVAELRDLGFKIAIDDLGGGHARMGTFSPLDTDFVKLDMSLVRAVDKHPMKQRLIRSITELCRQQGTKVIGEGVETEAEAKMLVDLGCDLLQGYLIARPALPFCDPL